VEREGDLTIRHLAGLSMRVDRKRLFRPWLAQGAVLFGLAIGVRMWNASIDWSSISLGFTGGLGSGSSRLRCLHEHAKHWRAGSLNSDGQLAKDSIALKRACEASRVPRRNGRIEKEYEMREMVERMNTEELGAKTLGSKMIYVVSDSTGEMARLLISRLLVQFNDPPLVRVIGFVQSPEALAESLFEARSFKADLMLFGTFVDPKMIRWFEKLATDSKVPHINVMSPLLEELNTFLDVQARGVPGSGISRRRINDLVSKQFLGMVEAMQFLQEHSGGMNKQGWVDADIVLVGPSRVGKRGLGSSLAQRGVKVAYMDIGPDVVLPNELLELPPHKVVLLTMEPPVLVRRRTNRFLELKKCELPVFFDPEYADLKQVRTEVEFIEDMDKACSDWVGPIDCTYMSEDDLSSKILRAVRDAKENKNEGNGWNFWPFSMMGLITIIATLGSGVSRAAISSTRKRTHSWGSLCGQGNPSSESMQFSGQTRQCLPIRPSVSCSSSRSGGRLVVQGVAEDDITAELQRVISTFQVPGEGILSQKAIYVISDSTGETAKLLISRLLVQYQEVGSPEVTIFGYVASKERLIEIFEQAKSLQQDVLFMGTLVDPEIHARFEELTSEYGVRYINVMQPLLNKVSDFLEKPALGIPEHQIEEKETEITAEQLVEMAGALKFWQQHSKGFNTHDWQEAEIVLCGISRTGKATIARLLALRGIKAASINLSYDRPIPEELLTIDPHKVMVVEMNFEMLLGRRRNRVKELQEQQIPNLLDHDYDDKDRIKKEVEFLSRLVWQHPRWLGPLDVTYLAADEACSKIYRRILYRRADID